VRWALGCVGTDDMSLTHGAADYACCLPLACEIGPGRKTVIVICGLRARRSMLSRGNRFACHSAALDQVWRWDSARVLTVKRQQSVTPPV
jgi:hypothetical protein